MNLVNSGTYDVRLNYVHWVCVLKIFIVAKKRLVGQASFCQQYYHCAYSIVSYLYSRTPLV